MALQPLFARVLIKRDGVGKIGSILIPEDAQKRNAQAKGTVVAVGPTCEPEIRELIGRTVVFGKYAGEWIKDGDDEVYLVQEEDLLGVVE